MATITYLAGHITDAAVSDASEKTAVSLPLSTTTQYTLSISTGIK